MGQAGSRGADRDRRFEEGRTARGSEAGFFCAVCQRPKLEDGHGECRSCRGARSVEAVDARRHAAHERASILAATGNTKAPEDPLLVRLLGKTKPQPPKKDQAPPPPCAKPTPTGPCLLSSAHPTMIPCRGPRAPEGIIPGVKVSPVRASAPAARPLPPPPTPPAPAPAFVVEEARLASAARTQHEGRIVDGERLARERAAQKLPIGRGNRLHGDLPRNVTLRGNVFYFEATIDGRKIAKSLKTRDRATAIKSAEVMRAQYEKAAAATVIPSDAPLEVLTPEEVGALEAVDATASAKEAEQAAAPYPCGLTQADVDYATELWDLGRGKSQREVAVALSERVGRPISQITVSRVVRANRPAATARAEEAHTASSTHLKVCPTCSRAGGFNAPAGRLCLLGRTLVRRWERMEAEAIGEAT